MEKEETFIKRENNRQLFDKRLIIEIVKEIEEGQPRRVAIAAHGMSISALNGWMNLYGSPDYHAKKKRRYSPSEKRSVIRSVEGGMSIKEAQVSFGISNVAVVREWVRTFKKENSDLSFNNSSQPMAKPSNKKETEEVEVLKRALAEAELKVKALDTLIDIAEEQLKIDIRKKSGARQSPK
jgi:transposase-like protein